MLGRSRPLSPGAPRVLAAVLVGVLALVGCDEPRELFVGDAGPAPDAAIVRRRALVPESNGVVTLAPLAERTLRVRLLEDEAPVAGASIAFALEGSVRSSTLRALEGVTSSDGAASVTLVAGPLPTTFRLRVTASGAAPVVIDVSVGSEFGDLEVTLEPDVTRDVAAYLVQLVADVPCASIPSSPSGGDERTLTSGIVVTTYRSLPTSASWTLSVRGRSEAGVIVARGCAEGIRVSPHATARSSVAVHDLPLDPGGSFALALELDATTATAPVARSLLEASTPARDAALLLDGLASALEGSRDAATLIAARREGLDAQLAAQLEREGSTWAASVSSLATDATDALGSVRLEGTLVVGDPVRVTSLRASAAGSVLPPSFEASLARLASVSGRDAIAISGFDVEVGGASLWLSTLDALARRAGSDVAASVREGESCAALVALVESDPRLASCDERCVRGGCAAAADELLRSLAERARALDDRLKRLRFDATLAMHDDDRDLRADRLDGDVQLFWLSDDGASALELPGRVAADREAPLD